jgi:hypothetical protein
LSKEDARPETQATGTLKYPVASVEVPVIENIAKSAVFVLLLIRKWPFTGLVESSIVRRNA